MLQQLTWQQFVIAALILTFCWYAAVILIYYRKEVATMIKGATSPFTLRQSTKDNQGVDDHDHEETLMGKSKLPEGVTEVPMNGFSFKGAEPSNQGPSQEQQLSSIPDLLEEIKETFKVLKQRSGEKEDFLSLFSMICSKYTMLRNTAIREIIASYIREKAPFEISDDDLKEVWTTSVAA